MSLNLISYDNGNGYSIYPNSVKANNIIAVESFTASGIVNFADVSAQNINLGNAQIQASNLITQQQIITIPNTLGQPNQMALFGIGGQINSYGQPNNPATVSLNSGTGTVQNVDFYLIRIGYNCDLWLSFQVAYTIAPNPSAYTFDFTLQMPVQVIPINVPNFQPIVSIYPYNVPTGANTIAPGAVYMIPQVNNICQVIVNTYPGNIQTNIQTFIGLNIKFTTATLF